MAQKSYDWSKLLYSGISSPINRSGGQDSWEYSGGVPQYSPMAQLGGQALDPSDFGKYGTFLQDAFSYGTPEFIADPYGSDGSIANPSFDRAAYDEAQKAYNANPTFTATRIMQDGTRQNDNQYETAGFKVQADPDGKQYLVPSGAWTPTNRDSGGAVQDFLKFLAVAGAGGLATGAFGGAGLFGGAGASAGASGAAAGATGAGAATNAALIESALGTAGYGASSAGLGGGAGLLAGAAAFDPVGAYLTSGAVDGSVAGAGAGYGGYAGAVGAAAAPEVLSLAIPGSATFGSSGLLPGNADKAAMFGPEGYGAGMTGAATAAFDAALPSAGSGLFGKIGDLLSKPGVGKLIGSLIGGAAAGGAGGGGSGGAGAAVPPSAARTWQTPTQAVMPSAAPPPSGPVDLRNSAGVFAEYMRQNMLKKTPTFLAPQMSGGGGRSGLFPLPTGPIMDEGRYGRGGG